MIVTANRSYCFAGANNRPIAGTATFSDGKVYDWMVHPIDGDIIFHTDRKQAGYSDTVSFKSAKRAAAIMAAIQRA